MRILSIGYRVLLPLVLSLLLGWTGVALGSGNGRGQTLGNPWAQVPGPLPGPPRVVGGYAAGCVGGAVSLLPDEGDFQLMRKSRKRYYAHPDLRRFIKGLAAEVRQHNLGRLLVGDLGQPRGGPTSNGHASHQIGLDADFWFWLDSPARRLTRAEEENLSAPSMLNSGFTAADPRRFRENQVRMLRYVATRPEVDRVFVHAYIKQALCARTDGAAWLAKIRPWWGHHYHFHVRLKCPPNQPACKAQEPLSGDPGCGEDLDWWLEAEANARSAQAPEVDKETAAQRLTRRLAQVPAECKVMLR